MFLCFITTCPKILITRRGTDVLNSYCVMLTCTLTSCLRVAYVFWCLLYLLQLRRENKLTKSSVMVTAGANQVKCLFHLHFYMFCMPLILLCKVVRLCSPIYFYSLVLWTHSFFPVQPCLFLHLYFQAFVNLVLTPCDAGDSAVMLAPYYFNACMTFQMAVFYWHISWDCDPKTLHSDVGEITILL